MDGEMTGLIILSPKPLLVIFRKSSGKVRRLTMSL
jgi:hypothetical protein